MSAFELNCSELCFDGVGLEHTSKVILTNLEMVKSLADYKMCVIMYVLHLKIHLSRHVNLLKGSSLVGGLFQK